MTTQISSLLTPKRKRRGPPPTDINLVNATVLQARQQETAQRVRETLVKSVSEQYAIAPEGVGQWLDKGGKIEDLVANLPMRRFAVDYQGPGIVGALQNLLKPIQEVQQTALGLVGAGLEQAAPVKMERPFSAAVPHGVPAIIKEEEKLPLAARIAGETLVPPFGVLGPTQLGGAVKLGALAGRGAKAAAETVLPTAHQLAVGEAGAIGGRAAKRDAAFAAKQAVVTQPPSGVRFGPDWTAQHQALLDASKQQLTSLQASAGKARAAGELSTLEDLTKIDIPEVQQAIAKLETKYQSSLAPTVGEIAKTLHIDPADAVNVRKAVQAESFSLADLKPTDGPFDSGLPNMAQGPDTPRFPPDLPPDILLFPPGKSMPTLPSPRFLPELPPARLGKIPGTPELPPGRVPPVLPSGPDDFTYFREGYSRLGKILGKNVLEPEAYDYAMGRSLSTHSLLRDYQKKWNVGKAFITFSPIIKQSPQFRSSFFQAGNYQMHQISKMEIEGRYLAGILKEAFGEDVVKGAIIPNVTYTGPTGLGYKTAGTLRHLATYYDKGWYNIESLPIKQRAALREWNRILTADFTETKLRTNITTEAVEGIYIPHMMKGDKLTREAMVGAWDSYQRETPGVLKPRTSDELYDLIIELKGREVETDFNKLFLSRMTATSDFRSDYFLVESLARASKLDTAGKTLTQIQESMVKEAAKILGPDATSAERQRVAALGEYNRAIKQILQRHVMTSNIKEALDAGRALLLNTDVSVGLFRQGFLTGMGLLGLARTPADLAKVLPRFIGTYVNSAKFALTPDGGAMWMAEHASELQYRTLHGLVLNMTPNDFAISRTAASKSLIQHLPDIIPGIPQAKWLDERVQHAQFNILLPMFKLLLARHAELAIKGAQFDRVADAMGLHPVFGKTIGRLRGNIAKLLPDDIAEAGHDAINNFLGGVNYRKIRTDFGPANLIVQGLVLVEGWTRAQIGLMTQAATKAGPEGMIARRLLLGEIVLGTTLYAGLQHIFGNEVILNPLDPEFGKVDLPDGMRLVIMPHLTIMQAARALLLGYREEDDVRGLNEWQERQDALQRFLVGRRAQIPSAVVDMVKGEDFQGRKIDNKALYLTKQLVPVSAQNMAEKTAETDNSVSELATHAVLSFGGATTYRSPRAETLGRYAANDTGLRAEIDAQRAAPGVDVQPWDGKWEHLAASEKKRISRNTEEGRRIESLYGDTARSRFEEKVAEFVTAQKEYDTAFRLQEYHGKYFGGKAWRDVTATKNVALAATKEALDDEWEAMTRSPGTGQSLQDERERTVKEYFDLQDKFTKHVDLKDPGSFVKYFDHDGWWEASSRYLDNLRPDLRGWLTLTINSDATSLEREFAKDLKELITPLYFRAVDSRVKAAHQAAWRYYKSLPDHKQTGFLVDHKELVQYVAGDSENPGEEEVRYLARLNNKALDAALVRWEYLTKAVRETRSPFPRPKQAPTPKPVKVPKLPARGF